MAKTQVPGGYIEDDAITSAKIADNTIQVGHLHSSHGITTDNIAQGSSNKYYTDAQVDTRLAATKSSNLVTTGNLLISSDTGEIKLGAGPDLFIKHDGSNSYMENYTGDLYIKNFADDKDIIFQSDNGSGGTTTYFFLDGSQTNTNFQKDIIFADNKKALFGGSGDLQIFHDGSHSRIKDTGTGNLILNTQAFRVNGADDAEGMIKANQDGNVELYYNGSKKLETTSGGAYVTGAVAATEYLQAGSSSFLRFSAGSSTTPSILFGDSSGTGGTLSFKRNSDSTVAMTVAADGDVAITKDLTVTGNLTVNGSTTTISTATLDVEDKNITLNKGSGDTSSSADGAGITIQDAVNASTDATILWDATNDEFDFSHPIKTSNIGVTNIVTNKVVKFNGSILDDSNITDTGSAITLGSNTSVSGDMTATGRIRSNESSGGFYKHHTDGTFRAAFYDNNSDTAIYADGDGSNPFITFSGGATHTTDIDGILNLSNTNASLRIGGTEVISTGRNLANIGTGSFSGTVSINQGSSFSKLQIGTSRTGATENIGAVEFLNSSNALKAQVYGSNDGKLRLTTNGSTVALTLDASQNATFAGTISSGAITSSGTISSGAITSTGNITLAEYLYHSGDTDTNLRFQTNRATLTSGGGAIVDAHSNGQLYLTGSTVQVYGNYNSTGTISSGAISSSGSVTASSGSNQSQLTNVGSLEITRADANAFIDFKSSTSEDYDCRIQQSGNGLIFQTGGNGSAATGLTINSSRNATFAGTITSSGNVQHTGLTMTDGTDIDQLKTFTESLTLSDAWQDTSISGTDLATGTYIVQVYAHDYAVGGGHYNEYYSGTMSWYQASTNSTQADEIILHRAGHAPNAGDIYLRTERHSSGTLMLQIRGSTSNSGSSNYVLKFRRMI